VIWSYDKNILYHEQIYGNHLNMYVRTKCVWFFLTKLHNRPQLDGQIILNNIPDHK